MASGAADCRGYVTVCLVLSAAVRFAHIAATYTQWCAMHGVFGTGYLVATHAVGMAQTRTPQVVRGSYRSRPRSPARRGDIPFYRRPAKAVD